MATASVAFDVDSTGTIGNVQYNANVTGYFDKSALTPGADTVYYFAPTIYLYQLTSYILSPADQQAIIAAYAMTVGVNPSNVSITYYYIYSYSSSDYNGYVNLLVSGTAADAAAASAMENTLYYSFSTSTFNTNLATTSVTYGAPDLNNTMCNYWYESYFYYYDPTYQFRSGKTVYFSNQSYAWSTNNGWNSDGSINIASQSIWYNFINWDATGSFSYGSNLYSISAFETSYGSDSTELYVYGTGNYGGNWESWYASLVQSTLIVSDSVLGHAIGQIQYIGENNGQNASVIYYSYVTDDNDNKVLASDDYLHWSTGSSWTEAGSIQVFSDWDLVNYLAFNVTGSLDYGNDKYYFYLKESDTYNSGQDDVFAFGYGQYGGSWSQWYATLDEGYLYYNDGLLGTANGDIIGITPDSWDNGYVVYKTNGFDTNYNKVLTTSGSTTWQSNSTWTERGYFNAISQVWVKDTINWNASALFYYGDNAYKLNIQESALAQQNDDDYNLVTSTVSNNFITMFQGGYGSSGYNEG